MIVISKYFDMRCDMDIQYEKSIRILKALSDENRIQILSLLKNNELCACVLQENLNLSQSGLSYHMKILINSGLVDSRQEGKWTHYKINEKNAKEAIDIFKKILNQNN